MKHKKYYLLIVFIFIQICSTFFNVSYTTVKAETADEQLNESIHEMLNALDLKELQAYVDGLSEISEESVKERLLAYIKGSPTDYERFWSEISHVLFKNIATAMQKHT